MERGVQRCETDAYGAYGRQTSRWYEWSVRVISARLAIRRAGVWILDEPFTSLDDKGRRFMAGEFRGHLDAGGVIVMTSHDEINWQGIEPLRVGL